MNRSIAGLLLASAALLGSASAPANTTLRCESSDGRWKACNVDTRGGVTLSRQLSQAGCWQGDTWGYDRNRIWVTNGCRAEFRVGDDRGASSGNSNAAVAGALILGAIAGAAIANHHDHDRDDDRRPDCGPRGCNDGWGGGGWSGGPERHFTCESQDGRMTWCRQTVDRRERIELTRQLSRGECTWGRTWASTGKSGSIAAAARSSSSTEVPTGSPAALAAGRRRAASWTFPHGIAHGPPPVVRPMAARAVPRPHDRRLLGDLAGGAEDQPRAGRRPDADLVPLPRRGGADGRVARVARTAGHAYKALSTRQKGMLALAGVMLLGNYVFYLLGVQYTTPANAQLLIQLAPLLMALGGIVVFRERFAAGQWIGLALIVGGLWLFFDEQRAGHGAGYVHGALLVVAAAVVWAVYALVQKQLLMALSSPAILWAIYVVAALLLWPFASPSKVLAVDGVHALLLGYCALNTLVAYGAFAEALAHWEASRVSAILALTPLLCVATVAAVHALWPSAIAPERIGLPG